MTTAEIIMAIVGIATLIGGFLKAVHAVEESQADRKAFEKRIVTMLDNIDVQYQ